MRCPAGWGATGYGGFLVDDGFPEPPVGTVSVIRELSQSLISDRPLKAYVRKVLQSALHDQRNRVATFEAALLAHRMGRHHRLLGALNFVFEYVTDPRYLSSLAREEPGLFLRTAELLLGIDKQDSDSYRRFTDPPKTSQAGEYDPRSLNVFLGGGSQVAVLPREILESPDMRRRMKQVVDVLTRAEKDLRPPPRESGLVEMGEGDGSGDVESREPDQP
jgi:hypothetical protein